MSKLTNNTFLYAGANILVALSAFIFLPIYTKYLTVEEFGLVSSMQSLLSLLCVFMTLALGTSVFRLYHDYSPSDKKTFLGTIIIAVLGISIVMTSIFFTGHHILNKMFPSIKFFPYYAITIIFTMITAIESIFLSSLQIVHRAKSYVTVSLALSLGTTALTLILLIQFKAGALGYLYAMLFGTIPPLLLFLYMTRNMITYSFNIKMFVAALKYSMPMFPSLLFAWVINLSDRAFIDNFQSQEDLGIYSIGYKIASITMMASSACYMAYNPIFYEIANNKPPIEAKSILFRYNSALIIIIGVMAMTVSLFSSEVLLLFRHEYTRSLPIIRIFSVAFFFSQISGILNLMIYQKKKTYKAAIGIILSGCINILLNYLLVPVYGIKAAAFASLSSAILNFFAVWLFARKEYYIKLDFYMITLFAVVITSIYLFLPDPQAKYSVNILMVKLIVVSSIGALLAYKYKNIVLRETSRLVHNIGKICR